MTGNDFTAPRVWAVPFATVAAVLGERPAVAATVDYCDSSSPFRIEATLGEWRLSTSVHAPGPCLWVSIASGTLHDEDKGAFDLAGFEIGLGASDPEPCEVLNPGRLSELQQAGLVDAVASHLRSLGIHCVAATLISLDGTATVDGVLGTSRESGKALAVFGAPRSAWEAAGAMAVLSTLAATHAVTPLTTIASSHSLALHVHAVSIDDAVCLVGRLD